MMNLETLVMQYGENKDAADKYKKLCDSQNKEIKTIMRTEGLDEAVGGQYVAKYSIQERETVDENGLLEYLKENTAAKDLGIIKTTEYIDDDALQDAIYKELIPNDIIAGMSKFNSVKEVEVLRISKKKEKKNG